MGLIHTFTPLGGTKISDNLQFGCIQGNTDAVLERTTMQDNVSGDSLEYDTERTKVFKRPNRLILYKGTLDTEQSWSNIGDIEAADIERMNTLNSSNAIKTTSGYTESSVSDAITNKKFTFSYEYSQTYNTLSERPYLYALAVDHALMRAAVDDTRILCILTDGVSYDANVLDIPVGETKTVSQQGTENYIFFTKAASIGSNDIAEATVKKLTSASVDVKNESTEINRIVVVSK